MKLGGLVVGGLVLVVALFATWRYCGPGVGRATQLVSREIESAIQRRVRVEDPITLAQHVLRGRAEAAPGKIEELIAGAATTAIDLPEPLPVHIVYFTAVVEENGAVAFRDDIYGIDQNLIEELRSRTRARARQ